MKRTAASVYTKLNKGSIENLYSRGVKAAFSEKVGKAQLLHNLKKERFWFLPKASVKKRVKNESDTKRFTQKQLHTGKHHSPILNDFKDYKITLGIFQKIVDSYKKIRQRHLKSTQIENQTVHKFRI